MKVWPSCMLDRNFCKFLVDWIRNRHSVLPQTFHSPSVPRQGTPVKVSGSTNSPFTKKEPIKLKILTFLPARKKISKFLGGWIGNHDSVLPQTLHSPSVPGQGTPVKVSGSTNLPFAKKEPTKLNILTVLLAWKKISKILGGWIGNHDSVLPQTLHSPSVPGQGTPVKVSGSTNLPFAKKEPTKLNILTVLPARKKISKFLGGWIGNHDSVLPQTLHSPSVPGQETPVKVLGSTNIPFRKKRPTKFESLTFLPARQKSLQVFRRLD